MATKKLQFPYEGVNINFAASTQPEFTSPYLNNVRPFDVLESRARGGQRPGMRKVFEQCLGDADDDGSPQPIVAICSVTTVEV